MRIADTSSNVNYNDIKVDTDAERGSIEWFRAVKKSGYKFYYRWINSDTDWMFFATNEARANEGRAELWSENKNETIERGREWSYEDIDIYSLDEFIANE